mmetsp:Transcript_61090/g.176021  ORF Transcript_61090/g.176021 Transcript_61090/m.176021 type:complete len:369 (+) Transcript_61090:282-1388(+)
MLVIRTTDLEGQAIGPLLASLGALRGVQAHLVEVAVPAVRIEARPRWIHARVAIESRLDAQALVDKRAIACVLALPVELRPATLDVALRRVEAGSPTPVLDQLAVEARLQSRLLAVVDGVDGLTAEVSACPARPQTRLRSRGRGRRRRCRRHRHRGHRTGKVREEPVGAVLFLLGIRGKTIARRAHLLNVVHNVLRGVGVAALGELAHIRRGTRDQAVQVAHLLLHIADCVALRVDLGLGDLGGRPDPLGGHRLLHGIGAGVGEVHAAVVVRRQDLRGNPRALASEVALHERLVDLGALADPILRDTELRAAIVVADSVGAVPVDPIDLRGEPEVTSGRPLHFNLLVNLERFLGLLGRLLLSAAIALH